MTEHDGLRSPATRRAFLRTGLGAAVAAMISAGTGTRRAHAGGELSIEPAKRCVLLFMHGGPSQLDTFDPKPGRPTGGSFAAIDSSLTGLRVSEHLPGLAARMHRLSLIRTLTAKEGNHERARHLMHCGFAPQGGVVHPAFGAHVARARASEAGELPSYVSVNLPGQGPGFLGGRFAPFSIIDAEQPVRNLAPPTELRAPRIARRTELWRALEQGFAAEHGSAQVEAGHQIAEQAVIMSRAPELGAFDLAQASEADRRRYGPGSFAQGCLLARRLLEADVPFVEVGMRGWDTHEDNFERVRSLSGELDRGASALLDDLQASGLWSETVVLWLGDFGRTPRINGKGGRDHFPDIAAAWLGGGPIREGQVVGASDRDGQDIVERPVTVPELFASLAAALGIDGQEVHETASGRPVTTVDESGEPLAELF